MHASFLISVGVTCLAAFLGFNCPKILALFFLVFALFSLVLDFFLAPPFLQIGVLLAALIWAQNLYRINRINQS